MKEMVLKLYVNILSPPSRAVLMLVKELKLDVELIDVNLEEDEHLTDNYLKINPQHTVPSLLDDDFILWDSHTIASYLVGKYSIDDQLYPKDLKRRALIDQRLHFDTGIIFPCVKSVLKPLFVNDEKEEIQIETVTAIQEAYNFLESFLNNGKYLTGEDMTIADLCCVATISTATIITPIPSNKFPKLFKWYNLMKTLPYYKEANEIGLNALDSLLKKKISVGIS